MKIDSKSNKIEASTHFFVHMGQIGAMLLPRSTKTTVTSVVKPLGKTKDERQTSNDGECAPGLVHFLHAL